MLTVAPGEELYSTFGHSAIRVRDSINPQTIEDRVYNYGTFNFNDDGFYLKFIRGKLLYYVNSDIYHNFKFENMAENRAMTEQVLNLTPAEKEIISHALIENSKEENKFYLYDFFFDNCTTRLRDIIVKYRKPAPALPYVMPPHFTFRNAIHQYLDNNNKDWSKLGIDLLLGAPTDAVMTSAQQQFLPDNLMIAFDSSMNQKLVSAKTNVYAVNPSKNDATLFIPLLLFSLIAGVYIICSLVPVAGIQRFFIRLDGLLFFIVGLTGILLLLMWFATDHVMTKNNYNLLWAWPFHCIYAFVLNKKGMRVQFYSALTCIFLLLVLITWHWLAQEMNNAFLPVVVLLAYRSGLRGFIRPLNASVQWKKRT